MMQEGGEYGGKERRGVCRKGGRKGEDRGVNEEKKKGWSEGKEKRLTAGG